jgi:hypothetical protein
VPLNHLQMHAVAFCLHCGLEQAFEPMRWRDGLDHAHAIGDLFRDGGAGGLDNPARTVGTTQTGVSFLTPGDNELLVVASPGAPLCAGCHAPLEVDVRPQDCTTLCRPCSDQATYALPEGLGFVTRSLRAIVGAEHRTDRPAVKVEESTASAAVAIACPRCSAPLTPSEDSRLMTCAYCKTACRVPDRTWWRLRGGNPTSESMWLLFSGPSPKRQQLALAQQHKQEEEQRDAAQAAQKRLKDEQRERERAAERERQRAADAEREAKKRVEELEKEARDSAWGPAIGPLLVISLGFPMGIYAVLMRAFPDWLGAWLVGAMVVCGALFAGGIWGVITPATDRAAREARQRAEEAERQGPERVAANAAQEKAMADARRRRIKGLGWVSGVVLVLGVALGLACTWNMGTRSRSGSGSSGHTSPAQPSRGKGR